MRTSFTLVALLAAVASVAADADPLTRGPQEIAEPAPALPATWPGGHRYPPPPNLEAREAKKGSGGSSGGSSGDDGPSSPGPVPADPADPDPAAPNPASPNPKVPLPKGKGGGSDPSSTSSLNRLCKPSLTSLLAGLPTPQTTVHPDFPKWASSSAPLPLLLPVVTTTSVASNINIGSLCSRAAAVVTPPPELAKAYADYTDAVQAWRYSVEGHAYRLARNCGHHVGLGAELLMATEAAMCTSGLSASVAPWATQGAHAAGSGGGKKNGAAGVGVGVGLAVGMAVVVGGVLGGL